ncbi:helix-turn-helix domain-containing protein [Collinsella stercoris]|uniref:helix-turn-helix domain-containing protein n=1 Tax=Collinsella stercoris TaxID=147206 RepID=UPI003996624E
MNLPRRSAFPPVNISRIKTGRLKGIRFSTLEAMCEALHCKPGDIIDWMDDEEYIAAFGSLPEA